MTDVNWGYFVLGIVFYQLVRMLYWVAQRRVAEQIQRRQDRRLIKQVRIAFPDAEPIQLITVRSSNRAAIKKIERELRDQAERAAERYRAQSDH